MKPALKWVGIVIGSLTSLTVLAGLVLYARGTAQLCRTHEIQAEAVPIPVDPVSLARGEHLVDVACRSCHGPELTGGLVFEDPTVGAVYGPNLTGLESTRSEADLIRAIRHGVARDGRQLLIMPAETFIHFSAEDLGSIIAYLKEVPAKPSSVPATQLRPAGRILLGVGVFGDVFPAAYIDHRHPFPPMPSVGATVDYGKYLSRMCTSCHGEDLTGGEPGDPDSPTAPSLATGGRIPFYSEQDFITTLRTGVTPFGYTLNPEFMPWESTAKFHDDELRALWMYFQSLAAPSNASTTPEARCLNAEAVASRP